MLNAFWEPLEFQLPHGYHSWSRCVDTSLDPPDDIVPWQEAPAVPGFTYRVGPRSVVVLQTEAPE